jgi:hypothetical protein
MWQVQKEKYKLYLLLQMFRALMRCKICKIVVGHANPRTRLRRVCGKCIYSIKKLLNIWGDNNNDE